MLPADLYRQIRRRVNQFKSLHLEDEELGWLCEESYFDLWDFLIGALGTEAPWERTEITTTANQEYVDAAVTVGIYRLLRLELMDQGGLYEPIRPLNLTADPIDPRAESWVSPDSVRYFARRGARATKEARAGSATAFAAWRFYFSPVPLGVYTLRAYYVPPPPIVIESSESGYGLFPDEWPEYVIADVAAKLCAKMKEDPSPFMAERERVKSRIELYATPHQANMPKRIADLRRGEPDGLGFVDGLWRRR